MIFKTNKKPGNNVLNWTFVSSSVHIQADSCSIYFCFMLTSMSKISINWRAEGLDLRAANKNDFILIAIMWSLHKKGKGFTENVFVNPEMQFENMKWLNWKWIENWMNSYVVLKRGLISGTKLIMTFSPWTVIELNVEMQTDFKPGLRRNQVHFMAACKISINCLFGALSWRETSQHFAAGIMLYGTEDPAHQILDSTSD